jgi:tetratricopeptide (TPR) repeat protein
VSAPRIAPPLAALAALLLLPLPAAGEGRGEEEAVQRAVEALTDEDVDAARAIVEPMLQASPDDRSALALAGMLRFHEQRYPEAVEYLERAGARRAGGIDYLALARAAREVTRDHRSAESAHFRVSYPPGKEEVLVPYLLETLEAQRAALLQDLGAAPPGKVTIEILRDARELSRLSTLTEEEIRTSGTIALCKFDKLMITSPKALVRGYDWLDTAAHEYTHFVVTQRTRNNTPIWLHEGLAKYSETRWRGAGGESLSPYAAALLQDAVKKDRLITFAQMHPSMAKLPSQEAASLAFAEVMVAVEYLQRKGGPPLVSRILDRVAEGMPAEQAVAHALGVPFDAFLADWKRYLAARPLPVGGDTELRRLRFQDDPKHGGGSWTEWADIPDERARGFARLGEIMRERGRWGAAWREYGKAMRRVGARYPMLTSKFALAAMNSGHDSEAEAALVEAARSHPHYAALHVNLGRLKLKRQDWKGAREALLLANRVDPFDPEIHAGLAAAAEALGDGEAASREQRFARILSGHGGEAAAGAAERPPGHPEGPAEHHPE